MKRSIWVFWIVLLTVTSFAFGLVLSLWGRPAAEIVMKVVGIVGVVSGLLLLTSRKLFERQPDGSTGAPIAVEHMVRMRMRIVGATGVFLGASQLVPDQRAGAVLLVCAAAVSMAGVFKVPRRLFTLQGHAE